MSEQTLEQLMSEQTLELTEPESSLRQQLRAGKAYDLCGKEFDDLTEEQRVAAMDTWGDDHFVRAKVLRAILSDCAKDWEKSQAKGVELKGVVVVSGGEKDCLGNFDGVKLPRFLMQWCRFDVSVNFDRAIFNGEARFDGSWFEHQARFVETTFERDARFEHTRFADAEFYKVTVLGDAEFYGATFGDAIPDDREPKPNGETVCADFRRARFKDNVGFRARFKRNAAFQWAKFDGDASFGAHGEECSWKTEPSLRDAAEFHGKVNFDHANFDGYAGFKAASFARDADFYQVTITGDADFYRATFTGPSGAEARFVRATFKGNAEFGGATFGVPAGFANASFAGNANFGTEKVPGATFEREADFYEATVASNAYFSGATFKQLARFERMNCVGDADFKNATFKGKGRFVRATCAAGITFLGANFDTEKASLDAYRLKTEMLNIRFASAPESLSLQDAQIGTIRDNPGIWPKKPRLTGCTYRRIQADTSPDDVSVWPRRRYFLLYHWYYHLLRRWRRPRTRVDKMGVKKRILWLQSERTGYDPFRYDQLIAAYRLAGDDWSASRVALSKQRGRRSTLKLPGKVWGVIQDGLVGYGYRLWLPVVWIVGLIALSSIAFSVGTGTGPADKDKAFPPNFHAIYYATDLLFPVVNFGQKSNFEFGGWRLYLAYILMVLGWLLAAAVLAGVQRLLTRQDK
jgi:uncharacterized protein YjbI with pentapeptide repeats